LAKQENIDLDNGISRQVRQEGRKKGKKESKKEKRMDPNYIGDQEKGEEDYRLTLMKSIRIIDTQCDYQKHAQQIY
jgi:hypothetical protein